MSKMFALDAYSPAQIAERVETEGVGKVALVFHFIYRAQASPGEGS